LIRSRRDLLLYVADLCQPEVLRVSDAGDGWPGIGDVKLDSGLQPVTIHVGPVGESHRGRETERRFQNPGQNRPVEVRDGTVPLLLGLWEDGGTPVLVGMDATTRIGRDTRQSFFVPVWQLQQAEQKGWSQHPSTTGELIVCFHPALLPAFVELRSSDLAPSLKEMQRVIEASGLLVDDPGSSRERARQATSRLTRDSAFRRVVMEAYGGECAVCGLDFGLLDGAHIYPVSAPESPDRVWNGLALCGTHHSAFDKHIIWVNPESRELRLHPDISAQADVSKASKQFVESIGTTLREPVLDAAKPRPEMFDKRYKFYDEKYAWAS